MNTQGITADRLRREHGDQPAAKPPARRDSGTISRASSTPASSSSAHNSPYPTSSSTMTYASTSDSSAQLKTISADTSSREHYSRVSSADPGQPATTTPSEASKVL